VNVKQSSSCRLAPFGVGLASFPRRASSELAAATASPWRRFRDASRGAVAFTSSPSNGFTYGAFQADEGERGVYRPDWLDPERVAFIANSPRVASSRPCCTDGVPGSV